MLLLVHYIGHQRQRSQQQMPVSTALWSMFTFCMYYSLQLILFISRISCIWCFCLFGLPLTFIKQYFLVVYQLVTHLRWWNKKAWNCKMLWFLTAFPCWRNLRLNSRIILVIIVNVRKSLIVLNMTERTRDPPTGGQTTPSVTPVMTCRLAPKLSRLQSSTA